MISKKVQNRSTPLGNRHGPAALGDSPRYLMPPVKSGFSRLRAYSSYPNRSSALLSSPLALGEDTDSGANKVSRRMSAQREHKLPGMNTALQEPAKKLRRYLAADLYAKFGPANVSFTVGLPSPQFC